jgi:polyisoprenoid-binding protein YceI
MSNTAVTTLRSHEGRPIPAPGVYDIDGDHTAVEFVARHLMITKVRGRFSSTRGRIIVDVAPERSRVDVEIDAASVSTGNDDRDAHLRSADFFDVERFPRITFSSTAVSGRRDGTWDLTGDLTIRGITRSVTLRVEFEGADRAPSGDERIGFGATGEVDREDFGLTWNVALETGGVLVSKIVRIELAVEAIAQGDVSGAVSTAR